MLVYVLVRLCYYCIRVTTSFKLLSLKTIDSSDNKHRIHLQLKRKIKKMIEKQQLKVAIIIFIVIYQIKIKELFSNYSGTIGPLTLCQVL